MTSIEQKDSSRTSERAANLGQHPFLPRFRARFLPRLLPLVAALSLFVLACSSAENQAAKERIFSPDEPPAHKLLAKEPLNPAKAASDPALWERILHMSRLEATERLGAHRAKSTLSFVWQHQKREISLSEEYRFEIDRTGDFHTSITNDQDFGLEFVWASYGAYAKSRYGKFRPRRIDRGQQDRWREEGSGSLSALLPLLDGRLGLKDANSAEHESRKALRFTPRLLDKPPATKNAPLPPPLFGQYKPEGESELAPGPDPDTARRLAFATNKELRALNGEILIDQETGVILLAKVEANFEVPAEDGEGEEPAKLQVKLDWSLTPDDSLQVLPPENAVPSETVHAVDNPLWFLEGEPGFEVEKAEESP